MRESQRCTGMAAGAGRFSSMGRRASGGKLVAEVEGAANTRKNLTFDPAWQPLCPGSERWTISFHHHRQTDGFVPRPGQLDSAGILAALQPLHHERRLPPGATPRWRSIPPPCYGKDAAYADGGNDPSEPIHPRPPISRGLDSRARNLTLLGARGLVMPYTAMGNIINENMMR